MLGESPSRHFAPLCWAPVRVGPRDTAEILGRRQEPGASSGDRALRRRPSERHAAVDGRILDAGYPQILGDWPGWGKPQLIVGQVVNTMSVPRGVPVVGSEARAPTTPGVPDGHPRHRRDPR
jgi:hypothetical protein